MFRLIDSEGWKKRGKNNNRYREGGEKFSPRVEKMENNEKQTR